MRNNNVLNLPLESEEQRDFLEELGTNSLTSPRKSGNIAGLVRAIASQQILCVPERYSERIGKKAKELGISLPEFWEAIANNALAVLPKQSTAMEIKFREFIENKQPFQISYRDASGKNWGYTVCYAELRDRFYKDGASRTYLDCWCEEGTESGNEEIPELSHNWSLRVDDDRYSGAEIVPVDREWRSRDSIDCTLLLRGGLAWGYEGHPDDITDSGKGESRTIVRRINSTYWLMPQLLRWGVNVKILAPESLRSKLIKTCSLILENNR